MAQKVSNAPMIAGKLTAGKSRGATEGEQIGAIGHRNAQGGRRGLINPLSRPRRQTNRVTLTL